MDEISRRKKNAIEELRNVFFPVTPANLPNRRSRHQNCFLELQAEVLEGLHPPPQITSLCIRDYSGRRYPSWLTEGLDNTGWNSTDVPDMQDLMFWDCDGPPPPKIGEHFVNLRILTIAGCTWESLPNNLDRLPSLHELNIQDCPNIDSLPLLPRSLTMFILADCNHSLTSSCQTEGHPNWRKIKHIAEKHIQ